jgi:ankyrin repeat protein
MIRALAYAGVGLFLAFPARLEPCTCNRELSREEAFAQASAVFLGVAVSKRDLNGQEGFLAVAFRFRVSKAWKGVSSETVELSTPYFETACGYQFEIGAEYLVYASDGPGIGSNINPPDQWAVGLLRRARNPLRLGTSSCSRTMRFRYAEEDDLPALGKPTWVNPGPKESYLSDELLRACADGDSVLVKSLLARGHDVNGRDRRHGQTALRAAARGGSVETVRVLLAAGADVQAEREGRTALDDAVAGRYVEVVRLLLGAGARPGPATLRLATSEGNGPVLEALLAGGLSARGKPGTEELETAARKGDVATARLLLEAGADPNLPLGAFIPPPLDIAVDKGNLEMVRLLVGKGARPTGKTLDVAVQTGNRDVVKLVQEASGGLAGAPKPGPGSLIMAVARGNLAGIELALESGVDVNARDEYGDTALSAAIRNPEAVRRLLKAGANPNLFGVNDSLPLSGAAIAGQLEVMKLLLEAGADLEGRSEGGESPTPLAYAVSGGRVEAVAVLLEAGADVNASQFESEDGSALGKAIGRGRVDMVRLLIAAGADVNARGKTSEVRDGQPVREAPPLTAAAAGGKPEIVQLLLVAGARVDARDEAGRTALQAAEAGGHQAVVELLRKAGGR